MPFLRFDIARVDLAFRLQREPRASRERLHCCEHLCERVLRFVLCNERDRLDHTAPALGGAGGVAGVQNLPHARLEDCTLFGDGLAPRYQ